MLQPWLDTGPANPIFSLEMPTPGPLLLLFLVIGVVLGDLQPPRLLDGLGEELILDTTTQPTLVLRCEGQQALYWSWSTPLQAENVDIETSNVTAGDYPFRSTLTVANAYTDDTGSYICHYMNTSMEDNIYVFVDDGRFDFVHPDTTLLVQATTAAATLVFDCRTTNPNTVVTLSRNGLPITSFDFNPRVGFTGPKPTLGDYGDYSCTTPNGREDSKKSILLDVSSGRPNQLPEPTIDAPGHGHFVVGHPFRLYCTVEHNKPVTFTWTNMQTASGPPAETVSGSEMSKKVVLEVNAEDVTEAGLFVYECNVNATNFESSSSRFNVTVKEEEDPHLLVSTDIGGTIRIDRGQPVQWKSNVDSFPHQANVDYYNPRGRRVVPDARISVRFDPHEGGEAWLIISNSTNEDFGLWVLEATTEAGLKNSTSLNITVMSAPTVSLLVPRVVLPADPVPVTCVVVAFPLPKPDSIMWHYADEATGCPIASLANGTCPASSYAEFQPALTSSILRFGNRITVEAIVPKSSSFRILRCSTSNRHGAKNSTALLVVSDLEARWMLQVDGLPRSRDATFLQVVVNDTFTVRCGATKGLYHSPQLTTPDGVSSVINETQYSISRTTLGGVATLASAGTYTCKVRTSSNEYVTRSMTIDVLAEARATTKGGDPIELVCDAQGSPAPSIQWTKDGEAIQFDSATVLSRNGQAMSMLHFLQEDVGLYTCIITWRDQRYEASCRKIMHDV